MPKMALAQITNTFPLNDSVGIGTTSPTELFQVNGNIKIATSIIAGFAPGGPGASTVFGANAMINNTTGSSNSAFGTGVLSQNLSGIGNSGFNKVRIGNASVSSNGGQVSWTAYSDARIKTKVKENVPGLEFINLLKPVTYHFDVDKQNEIMGVTNNEKVEGMYDIEKITFTGFLAQDVETAAKKINYDFPVWTKAVRF
jgi:hypothetical protein